MKYFNGEKYKSTLKQNETINAVNATFAIFAFTALPYSARQGSTEAIVISAIISIVLFIMPRYIKYIFCTTKHRVIVGASWIITSILAYGGYINHGSFGYGRFYSYLEIVDVFAFISMAIAFFTICHSLAKCGHEVETYEDI